MIDFDVETTGLQPWAPGLYAFMYIFMGDDLKPVAILTDAKAEINHDEIQAWFDRAKEDEEGIRAWNAKFDRGFALRMGFDIPGDGKWHDGMLVANAIDERVSAALKNTAVRLFGEGADDLQKKVKAYLTAERARRKKQAQIDKTELVEPNYSDVPLDIMEPYGLEDVILTRKVCDHFDNILIQQPDLQRVVDFERDVMDALFAVEARGLPARQEEYLKLEQEVIANLEPLEALCHKLAQEGDRAKYLEYLGKEPEVSEDGSTISWDGEGGDFNPSSTPQILAALYARGADMSYMETNESGKIVSADKDNLEAVDDELAAAVLKFRSERQVLSTYVRPMVGRSYVTSMRAWKEPFITPSGRIHTNYRQVGARTGRMSSADPNMQNQPRDDLRLRYNIVADPGYKLVACDLNNIEMFIFAAYCGEGKLLDAARRGEDMHALTAQMLGLRDRNRAGVGVETARQQGKTYNFSRIYGGGLKTIRKQFRCDREQAKLYKRRFDDAYPEAVNLAQRIEVRLYQQGYISDQLISGRRFRVAPQDAYKATNYLVQGTAASLFKYALINLHRDGIPVVALVHDEVVAHVPEDQAEATRDQIIKRLTEHEGLNAVVPLAADGEIVDRWSQAKDPLFVPNWAKS